MSEPVPTLQDTPAKIRDRAIAEANVLRQEVAELRELVRQMRAQINALQPHAGL